MSTLVNQLNIADSVVGYTCQHCSETFNKRKSLKKHLRKFHAIIDSKEKTGKGCFKCDYCDKSFRKVKTLNLHIREDHNNEEPHEQYESHEEETTEGKSIEDEEELLDTGVNANLMEENESERIEEEDEIVSENPKEEGTEGECLGEDKSKEEPIEGADETAWESNEEEKTREDSHQEEENAGGSIINDVELNEDEGENESNEDNEIKIEENDADDGNEVDDDGNEPNDDSLNEDISHLLELDMTDSSSDEMIVNNLDSSSDEINISGEATIEVVDDGELDQMAEATDSSRLRRKRSNQEMEQEEESNDAPVSRRKSSRISTDFNGEVTTDDIMEIEEVKPTTIKALKGKYDWAGKFPENLPESPDNIDELLNQSVYFQNKKSLIKSYYPSHKQYDVIDEDLPEGFRVWEQLRPNGKHVDKEFLTPDGKHVLRSKLAVYEYCKMILGTSEPSQGVKQSVKNNKSLKLSKNKVKKSIKVETEDSEISVVKCLPKGTNVKFTFVPDYPSSGKQTAKKYSCSLCKKIFLTRAGFDTHVMKDHKNARPVLTSSGSPAPAAKKLICSPLTVSAGSRKSKLLEHRKPDHPFKCMKCNARFEVRKSLEEHLIVEHYFKCEDCDIVFESRKSMNLHNEAAHTFKCVECAETFTTEEKSSAHLKTTHQSCDTCEDEFSWAEADHSCYYTKNGISPKSERVIEQNLYQGYFFYSRD